MNTSVTYFMFVILISTLLYLASNIYLVGYLNTKLMSNFIIFDTLMCFNKSILYFLLAVSVITLIISIYSFFYLGMSYKTMNFMWTLMLFAFSMLILIMSNSIMIYILGWDGLGASSFLLILFYNTLFSYRSGLATFLTNRLGDVFIIMSFVIMANKESIMPLSQSCPMQNSMMPLSLFFLLLGASTKSAQLPFSAWLPAAMAAPTPVSALVHSSTLVTAGIFLIFKYEQLLDLIYNNMSNVFCLLGILLSLFAGFMAFYETDFKKLVAMSTLSQLGILVYILFLKQPDITLIHIMSHAFFKSLLFLVVGYIIFMGMGMQDARTKTFPKMNSELAILMVSLTSLSLMGFMYMPGFFSKDLILTSFSDQGVGIVLYTLLIMACMLTVMYSIKSFIILTNSMHLKQNSSNMSFDKKFFMPSMCLFFLMMMFGYFLFFSMVESENYMTMFSTKTTGVFIIVGGMLLTFIFYSMMKNKKISKFYKYSVEKFSQMVNMNWISNNMMSSAALMVSNPLKEENSWLEMSTEKKTKDILKSNNFSLSKKFEKLTNYETLLFLLTSLVFLLIVSLSF